MNKKIGLILFAIIMCFSCVSVFAKEDIYSKKELESAILYLREHRDELNLTGFSIKEDINGLELMTERWTPEKEEKFKQLLEIENIDFVTDYGVVSDGITVRLMLKTADMGIYFRNCPTVDDVVLVPVRDLLEPLGYVIFWNDEEKTVVANNGSRKLIFTLSSDEVLDVLMSETDKALTIPIEVSPIIKNGKVYIPVNFISEISDYSVLPIDELFILVE